MQFFCVVHKWFSDSQNESFFSPLGLSLFFSFYLFVCPILRGRKNTEKSEKEVEMEKEKLGNAIHKSV